MVKTAKKVALVTGSTKGIGFETARQLAAMGIIVLLSGRDKETGETFANQLRSEGHVALFVELDVNNAEHHKRVSDFIEHKFGVLDILVNNAGIVLEADLPPVSIVSPDLIRTTFETNFFSVVALTQALLPLLYKSNSGRIVNVSSRLGSLNLNENPPTNVWYDELGYGASKASLNMFTILLAKELKNTRIKVNSAHPGSVKTTFGVATANMSVEDGAYTSVWLATLPDDAPTGKFFHKQESLPW